MTAHPVVLTTTASHDGGMEREKEREMEGRREGEIPCISQVCVCVSVCVCLFVLQTHGLSSPATQTQKGTSLQGQVDTPAVSPHLPGVPWTGNITPHITPHSQLPCMGVFV